MIGGAHICWGTDRQGSSKHEAESLPLVHRTAWLRQKQPQAALPWWGCQQDKTLSTHRQGPGQFNPGHMRPAGNAMKQATSLEQYRSAQTASA